MTNTLTRPTHLELTRQRAADARYAYDVAARTLAQLPADSPQRPRLAERAAALRLAAFRTKLMAEWAQAQLLVGSL